MKPHGRDCPDRCSLCLGATPLVVTLNNGAILVDGLVVGLGIEKPTPMQQHYARRGGKQHGRRRQG